MKIICDFFIYPKNQKQFNCYDFAKLNYFKQTVNGITTTKQRYNKYSVIKISKIVYLLFYYKVKINGSQLK